MPGLRDGHTTAEQRDTGSSDISRRDALKRGATLVAAGTVGLATVTGAATASSFCPRSPGYWMNHWHEKFGETVDIPPAGTLTKAEIHGILGAPPAGDKATIMAKHYVATSLNLRLRPDPDEACANKAVAVDGLGTVEWEDVKNRAQTWLRVAGWDGSHDTGTSEWTVHVDGIDADIDGEPLTDALDAFNNTAFDELDCDCGEDEESDEEDGGPPEDAGPPDDRGRDTNGPPDQAGGPDGSERGSGGPPERSGSTSDGGDGNGGPPDHAGPPSDDDGGRGGPPDHGGPPG